MSLAEKAGTGMAAKRVLVVEDEFLIALDIAGVLEQAGITVIGPAGSVGDALQAIDGEVVHGALLDAHLAGEPVNRAFGASTRLSSRRRARTPKCFIGPSSSP